MENPEGELPSSSLGTREYWDNTYSQEIKNFEDHGDVGEVWFGKVCSMKIIRYITTELKLAKKTTRIIDLGCGNGMTLLQLAKAGYRKLTGIDYSEPAIELARKIVKDADVVCDYDDDLEEIVLRVHDVTGEQALLDDQGSRCHYELAHDKGTYDAISLRPEDSRLMRERYARNVHGILVEGGWLAITSCNWTGDELTEHFADYFEFVHEIRGKTFDFGGQTGSRVTQVIFKKISINKKKEKIA